jgi:hypothetical protein
MSSSRGLVIMFLLVACNGGSAPSAKPPAAPAPPVQGSDPAHVAIPGIYAKACETQCADDFAEVVTYRDAADAIAIVTVQGSPQQCSHPPLRFLGPDGAERAVIPLQPVVPGSSEAKHFQDLRDQQLAGLTKAETMFCRDVKH